MLPIHHIENFLKFTPPNLQEIVLELRNVIFSVAPDAAEVVRWGGLSYFHEGRGGIVSAGICQIGIEKDHIRLAFIHGAFLDDPRKLLRGTQKAKRYVEIASYEDAPWDDLKELIVSASKFDPYSIKE
ncbi:MAG: DUF1801 domain-containing protein [Chloroflexi bacterium]|nr:DUF1801 domain-containing protein [Chloroflexota bacterium]